MDKQELLNADRRAKRTCESEKNLSYRGPFQYQVMIRTKGYEPFIKTFDDIDAAIAARDAAKTQRTAGTYVNTRKSKKKTLADLLAWYYAEFTPMKTKYPLKELSKMNAIKSCAVGDTPVISIDIKVLYAYVKERRSKVRIVKGSPKIISRKSIKEELQLIDRVIKNALRMREIELPFGNPVDVKYLLENIPDDAVKREAMSADEVNSLVSAAKLHSEAWLVDYIELSIATGLRRGEMLEQAWENVLIEDKYMRSKNKDPKRRADHETKEVPLSPSAREILNRMGAKKKGLLFPYAGERYISESNIDLVNDLIENLCIKYELPHVSPHIFRHTAATRAEEKGLDFGIIAKLTGHSIPSELNRYTHAKPREFADMFD